jgi:hypothetical protein
VRREYSKDDFPAFETELAAARGAARRGEITEVQHGIGADGTLFIDASAPVEWADPDFTGTCDHCGQVRPVVMRPDPYMAEVDPDAPSDVSAWCMPCYSARQDDV